ARSLPAALLWEHFVWTCAFFFFFFQAEDGIRDATVTGVQTCALPILPRPPSVRRSGRLLSHPLVQLLDGRGISGILGLALVGQRSEERRVGKECRARWVEEHE